MKGKEKAVAMNMEQSQQEIKDAWTQVFKCVQKRDFETIWRESASTMKEKYTSHYFASESLLADSQTLEVLVDSQHGDWSVEEDIAYKLIANGSVIVYMRRELASWKFYGLRKVRRELPPKSEGFKVDQRSIRRLSSEERSSVKQVMRFYRHAQKVIAACDPSQLKDLFVVERQHPTEVALENPYLKYYLENAQTEASRTVDCVRCGESEATLDLEGGRLVWYLIKVEQSWLIYRIIDMSSVLLNINKFPTFYFQKPK